MQKQISRGDNNKSTETYMLKQWTLVEPLPPATGLLRHASYEFGFALGASYQWQESCMVPVWLNGRGAGCAVARGLECELEAISRAQT